VSGGYHSMMIIVKKTSSNALENGVGLTDFSVGNVRILKTKQYS
jgi:hypothetical protein